MQRRQLGATGLTVSAVGFGGWAIGGPARLGDAVLGWGPRDDRRALAALETALDCGIDFFETADIYGGGHSEELIGQAFAGKRDRVILATKAGNCMDACGGWVKDFSAQHLRRALEGSLRRLRTDHVDLFQLHSPREGFLYVEALFETLEGFKAEGKIRHHGISIASLDDGELLAERGWGETLQVPYSMLQREVEERVLPAASTAEMGVIARTPLAGGWLTGKYDEDTVFHPDDWRSRRYPRESRAELVEAVDRLRHLERPDRTLSQSAIAFCLQHPAISTVIPGARNPAQVAENAAACDLEPPPVTLDA